MCEMVHLRKFKGFWIHLCILKNFPKLIGKQILQEGYSVEQLNGCFWLDTFYNELVIRRRIKEGTACKTHSVMSFKHLWKWTIFLHSTMYTFSFFGTIHIWRPWKLSHFQDPQLHLSSCIQISSTPLTMDVQF